MCRRRVVVSVARATCAEPALVGYQQLFIASAQEVVLSVFLLATLCENYRLDLRANIVSVDKEEMVKFWNYSTKCFERRVTPEHSLNEYY